jgi:hypothetical protein
MYNYIIAHFNHERHFYNYVYNKLTPVEVINYDKPTNVEFNQRTSHRTQQQETVAMNPEGPKQKQDRAQGKARTGLSLE